MNTCLYIYIYIFYFSGPQAICNYVAVYTIAILNPPPPDHHQHHQHHHHRRRRHHHHHRCQYCYTLMLVYLRYISSWGYLFRLTHIHFLLVDTRRCNIKQSTMFIHFPHQKSDMPMVKATKQDSHFNITRFLNHPHQ